MKNFSECLFYDDMETEARKRIAHQPARLIVKYAELITTLDSLTQKYLALHKGQKGRLDPNN